MTLWWRVGWILAMWKVLATWQNSRWLATGGSAPGQGVGESGLGFGVPGCGPTGMGSDFCSWWAARVTQEKRPSRIGVVRAMAWWDHWRWVSTPRWVRTSRKVTSSCQRSTNHWMIWTGSALGSVQSRAWVGTGIGVADQHPADGYRRLAGDVPEGGVGGQCHGAGMAAIPGHRRCGPGGVGMMQQLCQGGLSGADDAGPSPLTGLAGWRRMVETGIQTQAGDETYRLGQGAAALEQVQGGIGAVAYHHQVSVRQPPSQLQDQLSGPIGEFLGLRPEFGSRAPRVPGP